MCCFMGNIWATCSPRLSHNLMVLSSEVCSIYGSLGTQHRWVTRFLETDALSTHRPVPTSHRRRVLSRDPVHSSDESGLTANPVTTMAWPENCCLGCEEPCKSHIMTVLSREALKNWFDLGTQAILVISRSCPLNLFTTFPVFQL